MNPSPAINVASAVQGAPAAAKPAGGSSSDQSFGQVLAQQTNGAQANSPASGSSNAQNGASSGTGGTNGASGTNSSTGNGGSNSTSVGGKPVKSKHDQDNSQNAGSTQAAADPNAANGSAQLLALVSNVQQAAAATQTGSTSSTGTDDSAIGALVSTTTSNAQAALANFQAAAASTATAKADTPGTADITEDIKSALPQDAQQNAQDIGTDDNQTATTTAKALTQDAQTTTPLDADVQNTASAAQQAAALADAQKDLQANIASLDQAAAKSADSIRNTIAAATAAPAMVSSAPLTAATGQMSGANDKLTPQVGSPGWDQALGQKVVWMVTGGQQSASLTLNPPDLGPMQVVLNVTNSHATATFTAAQPEVRQALESAMPKLREMLGDAGIQLGQASVNAGTAQQQQNFAGQASQKSHGGNDAIDAIDGARAITAPVAARITSGVGLVDTFA
jgi:flagellar hook-length control protein FliK